MDNNTLDLYRAFWERREMPRPLIGITFGSGDHPRFPRTMAAIPPGQVRPEQVRLDEFLEDCERLYERQRGLGDFGYISAPFTSIPWLEAITGCPIFFNGTSFWAERCVTDWPGWQPARPGLDGPWARKLLELMDGLVERSAGRWPVAPTLMRGPADIMAAMGGAAQLPLLLMDEPEIARRAADLCAELWLEVAQAQLERVPTSTEGYLAGDAALMTWAPDKVAWLQEDAMALLSPRLYRRFFLPIDSRLANSVPCVAFHLHGSALWAIDELVHIPGIGAQELNLEDANCDVPGTLAGWKKIQQHKPLIIYRPYGPDFPAWLDEMRRELDAGRMCLNVLAANEADARRADAEFFAVWEKRPGQGSARAAGDA